MIPKVIHQTAPTKRLSWEEARLSKRLRATLPGWEYTLWDAADNARLVQKYFPHLFEAYREIQCEVVKVDIARCVYLFAYGGFYFDTDYKLLKLIDNDLCGHQCVLPISRGLAADEDTFRLGTAVLASAAGHPFWPHFLNHLFTSNALCDVRESGVEKISGPEGLTIFYLANKSHYQDIWLAPRYMFHPPVTHYGLSFQSSGSIGTHLCWGSWRTKNVLRTAKTLVTRKLTAL